MFYIIGISIAFFLFLLLISKKGKSTADKILAAWIFLMGVHLLLFYLSGIIMNFQFPHLLGIEIPFPLLHGPLLYLYTMAVTNRLPLGKKKLLLHFVPALISYFFMIKFFSLPGQEKIYVYLNKGKGFETFMFYNFNAIIVSGITYTTLSLLLLKKHRKAILDEFSYTEKIDLNWLRYLIYGIGVIWLIIIFIGGDYIIFGSVVLYILFMGYFGIKQGNIFTNVHPKFIPVPESPTEAERIQNTDEVPAEENTIGENEAKKKYVKSGLTRGASETIHKKLIEIVDAEKLYTDGELSLAALAERLNVHPNNLSQIINEIEGMNFYDFINSRRIEEFKKIVADPGNQKFTLLSLAFECGFNSKTSFNRQFKKVTGKSPSEYVQNFRMEVA